MLPIPSELLKNDGNGENKFTKAFNENNKVIYIAQLKDETKNVDLQFSRRVLAYVLKCPKRTYWEKCHQSKAKEIKDC
ncbi:unnamed protein product [Rotaria sordida]|uniref:Cwf19-like protein C-terminal domain-containing protein n=1 Tax=Rotaria sordida TaxID=392033 RepID=A0A819PJX2_9BILA|nr:unnamed protein product [Rotaria sordida]CAF4014072.1 unnamed protein product [Rotaria sordida]CAF4062763.1 unnamed protein product [Rotaria sordida]CAF4301906.1 unnamed protein product [Rotaria sordida]